MPVREKDREFARRMTQSQEHEGWGYELLLRRSDFYRFFDLLSDEGLFSPERTSGPVPATEPGHVMIPFWSALNYLEACAKYAKENNDFVLAEKVLGVIRQVSRANGPAGLPRDNYHTYRKFAETLGMLPLSILRDDDFELVPIWLNSKFDTGLVTHSLDTGLLVPLLTSETSRDWERACLVLHHCTEVQWVEESLPRGSAKKPRAIADEYWLKELLKHHAHTFGVKVGKSASELLFKRVREVFEPIERDGLVWLKRPAVEDSEQNHNYDAVPNLFVDGARQVLLAWIDNDPASARIFVGERLSDTSVMVRRIALFVLNQRWSLLHDLFPPLISVQLFDSNFLHELYALLRDRYSVLPDEVKTRILKSICEIPPTPLAENVELTTRYIQRNWLSAIAGKGDPKVDQWYEELNAYPDIGPLSNHPDFSSFMETRWGPGPTPYRPQELIAFASDGSLIEKLNAFQETDAWVGPSTKALVDALEESVSGDPKKFLSLLPKFISAKRPYQYGVVNGFKKVWEANKQTDFPWGAAWRALLELFEAILKEEGFWEEPSETTSGFIPNRDWIPRLIADFLRAGTTDDDKAFPEELLPRAWALIGLLLDKSAAIEQPGDDPMTFAINTSRGRVVEALFSHALKVCRLSDNKSKTHLHVWRDLESAFNTELDECKNGNFEFSTLAGAYISQIFYMDPEWLQARVKDIFPLEQKTNFLCAVAGLAYARITRPIYKLLVENQILDEALRTELKGGSTRDQLIERIALAYLWGDEDLTSGRFGYLFEAALIEDLKQACWYFWTVRNETITPEHVDRILLYWERCIEWSAAQKDPCVGLFSRLSLLSDYLARMDDRASRLLLSVAPFVHIEHHAEHFLEELERLFDSNPEKVTQVFEKLLETYTPEYDFEDRLKTLVTKVAETGQKRRAILLVERLRNLPGMPDLYSSWASST